MQTVWSDRRLLAMWGAVVAGLVVTGLLVDHFWSINTNFPEGRPIAATATPARRS